jgi:hypothetical protein
MKTDKKHRTQLKNPELSDWKCCLFVGDENDIVWRPVKGKEPNWFRRFMQFIILGNRWIYEPEHDNR